MCLHGPKTSWPRQEVSTSSALGEIRTFTVGSKRTVQFLEQRMKTLESSLSERSKAKSDDALLRVLPDLPMKDWTIMSPDISQDQSHKNSNNTLDASIAPPTMEQPHTSPLSQLGASKFAKFSSSILAASHKVQGDMDEGPFQHRLFARFPGQQHTIGLVEKVIEQIQPYGVLFSTERVLQEFQSQTLAGLDNCTDCPFRWAVVNSLFATAVLYKTYNGSLVSMSKTAWAYFKNAFAIFPDLILREPSVLTCEALLAMCFFLLHSADDQTTAHLAAAAARVVHGLGMHRVEYYCLMDTVEAERHRRVFWMTYILNVEIMHRHGLPSPFGYNEPEVEHPTDGGSIDMSADWLETHKSFGILRARAKLAIIQAQIHGLLSLPNDTQKGGVEFLGAAEKLHEALQSWKRTLPSHLDASHEDCRGVMETRQIHLLHIFYSCFPKIHMITDYVMSSTNFIDAGHMSSQLLHPASMSQFARAFCAVTARKVIRLLPLTSHHAFASLWFVYSCYSIARSAFC